MLPSFNIQKIAKKLKTRREAELEAIIKTLARNPMKKPTPKLKKKPTVGSDDSLLTILKQTHFSMSTLKELTDQIGWTFLRESSLHDEWAFEHDELLVYIEYFHAAIFKNRDLTDDATVVKHSINQGFSNEYYDVIENVEDWEGIPESRGFIDEKGRFYTEEWEDKSISPYPLCVLAPNLDEDDENDEMIRYWLDGLFGIGVITISKDAKKLKEGTIPANDPRVSEEIKLHYKIDLPDGFSMVSEEQFRVPRNFELIQENILNYVEDAVSVGGHGPHYLDILFDSLGNSQINVNVDKDGEIIDWNGLSDSAKKELKTLQSRGFIDVT